MKLFHQLEEELQTKVLALCTTKIIESIQNSTFEYDEEDEDISDLVERIRNDDRLLSEDYNEVNAAITEILKDNSGLIEDLSYDVATRSYYAEGDDNVIFLPDVDDEDYTCDNCSDDSCENRSEKNSTDDSTEFGKKFTDDVKKKFNLN